MLEAIGANGRKRQRGLRRQGAVVVPGTSGRRVNLKWAAIANILDFINDTQAIGDEFDQALIALLSNKEILIAIMTSNKKTPPMTMDNYAKVVKAMPAAFGQQGLWEATKDESLVLSVMRNGGLSYELEQYMIDQIQSPLGAPGASDPYAARSMDDETTVVTPEQIRRAMPLQYAIVESWAAQFLERDSSETFDNDWEIIKYNLQYSANGIMAAEMYFRDPGMQLRYKAFNILASHIDEIQDDPDAGEAFFTQDQLTDLAKRARAVRKSGAARKFEKRLAIEQLPEDQRPMGYEYAQTSTGRPNINLETGEPISATY